MRAMQIYEIRFFYTRLYCTYIVFNDFKEQSYQIQRKPNNAFGRDCCNKQIYEQRNCRMVELKLDLVSLVLIKKSYTSYWPLDTPKFMRKSAEHNLTSHSETDRETKLSPLPLSKRWRVAIVVFNCVVIGQE
ncbi:hypothetical protein AVEN_88290-1 [Araneus ventricosus]|uniref:Uncharacterized protein n=1 Tax=Araneus ventricosus TaxID=182803 RepID=A0A4Y2SGQ2_ARAVE|nr:hypothetical protein AVEN_88290-1 [Araneus ventricosus]